MKYSTSNIDTAIRRKPHIGISFLNQKFEVWILFRIFSEVTE